MIEKTIDTQGIEGQTKVLRHIQGVIAGLGLETRLYERDVNEPMLQAPILLFGLPRDQSGRDRTMNLAFLLENENDHFDYLSLIQFYAPVPFDIGSAARADILELIVAVNTLMPLGHFGVTTTNNLYYRYVLTTEKWARYDGPVYHQVILLISHLLDKYSPVFEALARGEVNLPAALEMIQS
jgi:hypothetical protein